MVDQGVSGRADSPSVVFNHAASQEIGYSAGTAATVSSCFSTRRRWRRQCPSMAQRAGEEAAELFRLWAEGVIDFGVEPPPVPATTTTLP